MLALICSESPLEGDLASTVLFRSGVERHEARTASEAQATARRIKPVVVLVNRDLAGAADLVKSLRADPETRRLSVVALARGDFAAHELTLLEAGANAVLRLPPSGDWDERLVRLMHVPARRDVRAAVTLELDLGLGATGEAFHALALNLSLNGLLIETRQELRLGDDVTFSFVLPSVGEEVEGGASVVRLAAAERYGLEILNVKDDGRRKIKSYVDGL
jgi:DNA-binding response OmpR family regulator